MRRPRKAVPQKAVQMSVIEEGDEQQAEDFAARVLSYSKGIPTLTEPEMQILSFGPIDQLIPFIQKISEAEFRGAENIPDFNHITKANLAIELKKIGLPGLEKIILRETDRGTYFNRFIEQLQNIDIFTLQHKLKNALVNRSVDPRIKTQLEVRKFANSDGSDAGMVTRFMNEWPGLIDDKIFKPWLAEFKKLTDKCVLFDEKGAVYKVDSENEAQTIDAASQKGIRQLIKNCIQQALQDFCDETGKIKPSIRKALQLDKLAVQVENNKITEELMLEKLVANYLANQVGSFLAEKASEGLREQLSSQDEQTNRQANYNVKKFSLLQQQFARILSEGATADFNELLTPRVEIHTSLSDLDAAVKKRKAQYGKDDPLYISSAETYNNARDISKQILSAPQIDREELNSFKAIVRGTAAVVRDPINGPSNELYEAVKKAPTKKSSAWAKLGAGVLFVLGVTAIACGLAGTAMSGGLDLGVATYLGCKIAGVCFAAAGALWAGYQYKQAGALAGSISKVVGAAKKAPKEDPSEIAPLQPRNINQP